ncbi:hypothetical protein [Myxococcus sp. Y35]
MWQGSMLVGKTRQRPERGIEHLRESRAYIDIDGLFEPPVKSRSKQSRRA